jgi:hypothetical protein
MYSIFIDTRIICPKKTYGLSELQFQIWIDACRFIGTIYRLQPLLESSFRILKSICMCIYQVCGWIDVHFVPCLSSALAQGPLAVKFGRYACLHGSNPNACREFSRRVRTCVHDLKAVWLCVHAYECAVRRSNSTVLTA